MTLFLAGTPEMFRFWHFAPGSHILFKPPLYGDWFYHTPAFRLSRQAAHISKMCILALNEQDKKYFGTLRLNGSALSQTPNAVFMLTKVNSAAITWWFSENARFRLKLTKVIQGHFEAYG